MSARTKLAGGATLVAVAFGLWRTFSPPAPIPSSAVPEPIAARQQPVVETPKAAPAPNPGSPKQPQPPAPAHDSNTLNERTLIGTKWERDGFALEFGQDGKLVIGGRARAQWRVEGTRIRLYREATGEEHWLDIVGPRLMWEGQEIGRVP